MQGMQQSSQSLGLESVSPFISNKRVFAYQSGPHGMSMHGCPGFLTLIGLAWRTGALWLEVVWEHMVSKRIELLWYV